MRFRPSGDYLLVQQYRPPADRFLVEFPAGRVFLSFSDRNTVLVVDAKTGNNWDEAH